MTDKTPLMTEEMLTAIKEEVEDLIRRDNEQVAKFTEAWSQNPLYAVTYDQDAALEAQVRLTIWERMRSVMSKAKTLEEAIDGYNAVVEVLTKDLHQYIGQHLNNSTSPSQNLVMATWVRVLNDQLHQPFKSDLRQLNYLLDRAVKRGSKA